MVYRRMGAEEVGFGFLLITNPSDLVPSSLLYTICFCQRPPLPGVGAEVQVRDAVNVRMWRS